MHQMPVLHRMGGFTARFVTPAMYPVGQDLFLKCKLLQTIKPKVETNNYEKQYCYCLCCCCYQYYCYCCVVVVVIIVNNQLDLLDRMVSSQRGEEVLFTNMDQEAEMDIKVNCEIYSFSIFK